MLKWKKDGTAKCGPFKVSFTKEAPKAVRVRIAVHGEGQGVHGVYGSLAWSVPQAKERADAWLRKQTKSMIKALGEY